MKTKATLLILALAMILGVSSCTKDEPCNCGTIANDGIDGSCYWLEIRNECSGNKKKFCFDQDVWMNNYVGDRFCVSNQNSW
ncbi:MAG: hypothetical protein RIR06_1594 [Bacteroidota bacterium]|jgi:hypothetical protein